MALSFKADSRQAVARIQREQIERRRSLQHFTLRWNEELRAKYASITIQEYLDGEEFLGPLLWVTDPDTGRRKCSLYQCHREDIELLFQYRQSHGIHTAVFIEAIGSGKSYKNGIIASKIVHEIYTTKDFYGMFNLTPGSEVSLICMGKTATQSKWVTYRKVIPWLRARFFQTYFPPKLDYDKFDAAERFPDRIQLPGNVLIFPGTGHAGSALGFSPYFVGVDEANHLELSVDTKRAAGLATGGVYDAAEQIYGMVGGRVASRFTREGRIHGLVVMFSDPRYVGDFLERKYEEAKRARDYYKIDEWRFVGGGIFCVRRPLWVAKPEMFTKDGQMKTFQFDVEGLQILD